jgi:hypothetical protein
MTINRAADAGGAGGTYRTVPADPKTQSPPPKTHSPPPKPRIGSANVDTPNKWCNKITDALDELGRAKKNLAGVQAKISPVGGEAKGVFGNVKMTPQAREAFNNASVGRVNALQNLSSAVAEEIERHAGPGANGDDLTEAGNHLKRLCANSREEEQEINNAVGDLWETRVVQGLAALTDAMKSRALSAAEKDAVINDAVKLVIEPRAGDALSREGAVFTASEVKVDAKVNQFKRLDSLLNAIKDRHLDPDLVRSVIDQCAQKMHIDNADDSLRLVSIIKVGLEGETKYNGE